MRGIAIAISTAVLGVTLALPSLLWAQEAVQPEAPPAAEEVPAEEAPPAAEEAPAPSAEEASPAAPSAYATAAKGSGTVNMGDNFFSPATITIDVGDTVTWSNSGQVDHTATGNGFNTGTMAPGASRSHTFSTAGTFAYVCALHSEMTGTVQVRAVPGGDPGGDPREDGTETGGPTGTTGTTPAPGSEAAAVLEPTKPGELPATGEPEGILILLGSGLIGCGLLAAATARLREREVLRLTDRPSSLP